MSIRRSRRAGLGVFCCALLVATLTAACGSSSKPSAAGSVDYLNLRTSDREAQLEAEARKEGHVTWYTSLVGAGSDAIIAGFKKKYPGIDVKAYVASAADVVTHISQEVQAGRSSFDVTEMNAPDVQALQEQKLLASFYSPEAEKLPDEFKATGSAPDMLITAADRVTYNGFGFNTKDVPESQAPTSWSDLTNPIWKGKLGITTHTNGPLWVGSLVETMGQANAEALFAQLKAQGVKPEALSEVATTALVGAGTLPGSLAMADAHAEELVAKGAPIKWVPINPVVANVGTVGISTQAPDPAAAMLFVDYVLSSDGQAQLASEEEKSPLVSEPWQIWTPTQGKTVAQQTQDMKDWTALFDKYFGTG